MNIRLPFLTLALAALAILVHVVPGATAALQFDRTAIAQGEWWRMFTGHLAHFDSNHLAWDLAALIGFGWRCETRWRGRSVAALSVASLAISSVVWLGQPQLEFYRGLSGLDCVLFGLFAADLLEHPGRGPKCLGAIALAGVIVKSAVEITTGSTVFASGQHYVPVPLAHLVGVATGVMVVMFTPRRRLLARPSLDRQRRAEHPVT